MIPDLSKANIYIICGRTDLRKGIDGLAALVTVGVQDGCVRQCVIHLLWYP